MKVATWNVNGIRARSSQVSHWIDGEEPDVICLQEIQKLDGGKLTNMWVFDQSLAVAQQLGLMPAPKK